MTLGEFADKLRRRGCYLVDGGIWPKVPDRVVTARLGTRTFVFIDEGPDVVLPRRFLRSACKSLFRESERMIAR